MARQQTAGRGRLGRKWVSPPDSGIYVSLLLRPAVPLVDLPVITLAVGVAASKAIEQSTGVKAGLKWVNDLVVEGRKLGGILAEMPSTYAPGGAQAPLKPALVIGIGINICLDEKEIPDELKDKIEWIERLTKSPIDFNTTLCQMAHELELAYDALLAGKTDEIIEQWKERTVTLGKEIIATTGNKTLEGRAVDITGSGALVVESSDGRRHELQAGEVVIRGKDGTYS